MNCSEKFKYVRNFSALSLVLNAFFSLPVHADDALLRACSNAKTAKDCQLPFQQGLSPVQVGLSREPLWGYVDTTGHMVIKPDFSEARGFVNDLAAAKKGDKFGYIDRTGELVIPARFDNAFAFSGGLARVPPSFARDSIFLRFFSGMVPCGTSTRRKPFW